MPKTDQKATFWGRFKAAATAFSNGLAFSTFGSGWAGGWDSLWGTLPGSSYDYRHEAGALWKNSIILPCLKWIETVFPEAPLIVRRRDSETGKFVVVPDHPLELLINDPNPFYGADMLWAGTNMDLSLSGNAYWYKIRAATGDVVQLWWLPKYMVAPVRSSNGRSYLDHYDYTVDSKTFQIPTSDIVHFRDGIDPDNDLLGLSRLEASLREVCTDNSRATMSAAIMRNMGVPGVVISPDGQALEEFTAAQANKLKADWKERTSGDSAGEPLVFPIPMKIASAGQSPKDLALDIISRIPEERISAALGVPAIVVGLGAGLARSTFANFKEAREAAYESSIIPRQRLYAMQIGRQLMPDFARKLPNGGKGDRVGFDLSEVRALQDDANDLWTRLELACGGSFITPNEARKEAGFANAIDGGDELRSPQAATDAPKIRDNVNDQNL